MYRLVVNQWNLALHEFSSLLLTSLKDNLVMIIGLDEDSSVRDSNVLVVVKKVDDQVRSLVTRAAIAVNDKYDCTISYYLTTEDDREAIELFNRAKTNSDYDCREAFNEFYNMIKNYVEDVVFLGNIYYHDSNVLVVVKNIDDKVRSIIARAAIAVNDKYDCTISYYLTEKEDEGLVNAFKEIRNSIFRSY